MPTVVSFFRTRRGAFLAALIALVFTFRFCSSAPMAIVEAASGDVPPVMAPEQITTGQFNPVIGKNECTGEVWQGWTEVGSPTRPYWQKVGGPTIMIDFFPDADYIELRGIYFVDDDVNGRCHQVALLDVYDYGAPAESGLYLALEDRQLWWTEKVASRVMVGAQSIHPMDATARVLTNGDLMVAYAAGAPTPEQFTRIVYRLRSKDGTWAAETPVDPDGDVHQGAPQIAEGAGLGVEFAFKGYREVGFPGLQAAWSHVSHAGETGQVRDVHEDIPYPGVNNPGSGTIALAKCAGQRCVIWSDGAKLYRRLHTGGNWEGASTQILTSLSGINAGPVSCGQSQVLSWNAQLAGPINLGVFSADNPHRRVLASFDLSVGDTDETTVSAACTAGWYGYMLKHVNGSWSVEFARLDVLIFMPLILR